MNLPQVNVIEDLVGTDLSVFKKKIFPDPCYQMIFPATLDDLMENVRRQHFVNVSTGEVIRKRLSSCYQ
jgi:hypothetical protein